jgi:uncharacterized protein (DUF885 family)
VKLQRTQLLFVLLVALAACGRSQHGPNEAQAKQAAARDELKKVVDSYYERYLELHPLIATRDGDARYDDRLVNDISEQAVADELALEKSSLQRLAAIDPATLDDTQRTTYDMFKYGREIAIDGYTFPSELLPVDQVDSTPILFAELGSGAGIQPFTTTADYERFLKRVGGFVAWIDQAIGNMKDGAAHGIVEPKVVVERVIARCVELAVDDPSKSVFYKPVESFPEQVAQVDRARLTDAYVKAIREQITPAYRKLATFLQKEYLPDARSSVGLGALPNGNRWYAHLVRHYTTTQLNADEVHELGRQELQRVRADMDKVRVQVGSKEDLKTFLAGLRGDPRFNFTSADEVLQTYGTLKERVTANVAALFAAVPQSEFEMRPMEEARAPAAAIAYFVTGTPDDSRPGVFYVNTHDAAARPRYMSESIYLHEADPGHHLQWAFQTRLSELPRLRRFSHEPVYVAGWASYAESLGRELGLYQDPYPYLGALMNDASRAAQLVVDTGLHAKGWTREKALAFMKDNTTLSDADIGIEVNRCIAKPGQALAETIGQLKIRELRSAAEKRLGAKFDLREFHRAILDGGPMPLDVLQSKIERWMNEEERKAL